MIEQDVVLLAVNDFVENSSGERIALEEGLRVDLYGEDADEDGRPTYLLASGVAERHSATDWSGRARWRCRIDEWREAPR